MCHKTTQVSKQIMTNNTNKTKNNKINKKIIKNKKVSACQKQADTPKKLTERKKYDKKKKKKKKKKKISHTTGQRKFCIHLIIAIMLLTKLATSPHGWKTTNVQNNWIEITNTPPKMNNWSTNCKRHLCASSQPEWKYEWKQIKKDINKKQHSLNGNVKNSVSIYHWNLGSRSWIKKVEDIQAAVDDYDPDYMFISESNLWEHEDDFRTQIMGYDIVKPLTCNTADNNISRIILLAKKGLHYQIIPQLMDKEITSIWIKIGNGRSKLIVGGVYREHSRMGMTTQVNTESDHEQHRRWKKFIHQWMEAADNPSCIVIGDTNLNKLRWDTPEQIHVPMVDITKEEIETRNFVQIVENPTRFWNSQASSLIDQIWVNCVEKIIEWKNIPRSTADHNIVSTVVRFKGVKTSQGEHMRRSMKNWDNTEYVRCISMIDWTELYECVNIDVANSMFEEKLLEVLDSLAPMEKVQHRKNQGNTWISNTTRENMRRRDTMRDKAVNSGLQTDWDEYKHMRNNCNSNVKTDRRDHLKKISDIHCKDKNSAGLFKMAKTRMGWTQEGPPNFLQVQGQIIKTPRQIANILAHHYKNKLQTLQKKLPPATKDPMFLLDMAMQRWGNYKNLRTSFTLKTVSLQETIKTIKSMKNSRAYGHNKIDPMSIKCAASHLCRPLNHITNLSLKNHKFANAWRIARVIPIFKGGKKSKSNPNSFRPISLLSIQSKIVEKHVQSQLDNYMMHTRQWNRNNHAYKSKHSTTTTLMEMTDDIFRACDEHEIAVAIGVDQTAAFDSVDYQTMYKKMTRYNFDKSTIQWMKSYLEDRTQYVTVGAHDSMMMAVESGVPQGSVLGPCLYTLYVNEIPDLVNNYNTCREQIHNTTEYLFNLNCKQCGSLPSYADDTTFVTSSRNRNSNQTRIVEIMKSITEILNSNHLTVNQGKTLLCEMMVKQKKARMKDEPPSLQIITEEGEVKIIKPKKDTVLLGCTIQENTTWQSHLDKGDKALIPKLRQKLGAIKYVARDFTREAKLLLINGHLVSHLLYLIPIWAGTDNKYLTKLQVTLNNAARFIENKGKRSKTLELMKSCGWLTIRELCTYHTNITTWKIIYWNIPANINQHISVDDDTNISTNLPRLQNTQRSYRWRAINCWNRQPEYLRQCSNLGKFKKMSRQWIIDARLPEPDEN